MDGDLNAQNAKCQIRDRRQLMFSGSEREGERVSTGELKWLDFFFFSLFGEWLSDSVLLDAVSWATKCGTTVSVEKETGRLNSWKWFRPKSSLDRVQNERVRPWMAEWLKWPNARHYAAYSGGGGLQCAMHNVHRPPNWTSPTHLNAQRFASQTAKSVYRPRSRSLSFHWFLISSDRESPSVLQTCSGIQE